MFCLQTTKLCRPDAVEQLVGPAGEWGVVSLQGEELKEYLCNQYLPTLLSPQQIQDYCAHLQADPKVFKSYLKAFFQGLRTS